MELLENLFDSKVIRVIKFFLVNKDKEFYLQEITKETGVPLATVFRLTQKLVALEIIHEIKIKKFKIYRSQNNDKTRFLESFIKEGKRITETFAEIASKLPNVEEIILYGKETEDKANLLLIGNSINSNKIKGICADFKEKYNYNITALNLEREQYNQMAAMGLYSSNKKTLFMRR